MKTKDAFCSKEQVITEHEVTLDGSGDFVFTCTCGGFFKVLGSLDKKGVADFLKVHEKANKGQVSIEEREKRLADF